MAPALPRPLSPRPALNTADTGLAPAGRPRRPEAGRALRADHDAARSSTTRPAKPRRSSTSRPASTPCSATRPSPSPTKTPTASWKRSRRRRPRPTSPASRDGYYLDLRRQGPRRHLRLRAGLREAAARKARRRPSPTPTSPANRTTPASSSSTGSSGTSTSSTTCTRATGRGCSSASSRTPRPAALQRRTERNHRLPARRRRARRVGRRKVQKEGTHPIVYPAAGSHATFYDSAVYVQNGQHGSGVGCDNTSEPLRELRPRPVLLPETASEQGPVPVAQLPRPLGRKGKGLQQRADRADDEDASGANRSPGWRSSARPARGCPAARSSARRSPAPSAAPSPRSPTSSTSTPSRDRRRSGSFVVLAGPDRAASSASPAGARSTSTSCGPGAPSARSCARRASSTAATGGPGADRADRASRSSAASICSPT